MLNNQIKLVKKICSAICDQLECWRIDSYFRPVIGKKLAEYILTQDDVNVTWPCKMVNGIFIKESIMDYLPFLEESLVGKLMSKGLDLAMTLNRKLVHDNWDYVDFLLRFSSIYQDRAQRLTWINQKYEQRKSVSTSHTMTFCWTCTISYSSELDYELGYTALQTAILKSDDHVDGIEDHHVKPYFHMARRLLELGADAAINYQEPYRGNTALHLAYLRRDLQAIELLESHGASNQVVNHKAEKPRQMLNYSQSKALDILNDAEYLNFNRFNSADNLAAIKQRFAPHSEREYSLISIAPH